MNETKEQNEEEVSDVVNFEELDNCLNLATDELKTLHKNFNDRLRTTRQQIELIRLSEKKLPLLLEEVRKLTGEIQRVSRDLTKLDILNTEKDHLKKAVGNLLISLDKRADDLSDIKLKHDIEVQMDKFKTANRIS